TSGTAAPDSSERVGSRGAERRLRRLLSTIMSRSAEPPMPDPATRASVIVLNYNGHQWLPGCLDALGRQAGDFETLVVDNASTDRSADDLGARPRVRVVRLDRNTG